MCSSSQGQGASGLTGAIPPPKHIHVTANLAGSARMPHPCRRLGTLLTHMSTRWQSVMRIYMGQRGRSPSGSTECQGTAPGMCSCGCLAPLRCFSALNGSCCRAGGGIGPHHQQPCPRRQRVPVGVACWSGSHRLEPEGLREERHPGGERQSWWSCHSIDWGQHTFVLGTLHRLSLVGFGHKSALTYQMPQPPDLHNKHGIRSPSFLLGDIQKCFPFSDGFLLY